MTAHASSSSSSFLDASIYGVVADGSHDDTSAVTSWLNDAIRYNKIAVGPGSVNNYKITDTIHIDPYSGNQTSLTLQIAGPFNTLTWAGGNSKSVIQSHGWKRGIVSGLQVRLPTSTSGVIAFDQDISVAYPSSGLLEWHNCHVSCAGTVTDCVGWRMGHAGVAGAAGSEESFNNFHNCSVQYAVGSSGGGNCMGWVNEHGNGLNHQWFGCAVAYCNTGWTNRSGTGAGDATGGSAMYFYGCGSQTSSTVFDFTRGGQYGMYGGRHELGDKLLKVQGNTAGDLVQTVDVAGVLCSSMGSGGVMFETIASSCQLGIRGSYFQAPDTVGFTSSFITLGSGTGGYGSLSVKDCAISDSADPFYSTSGSHSHKVFLENNAKMSTKSVNASSGSGFALGYYSDANV